MSIPTESKHLLLRRDTAANWTAADLTLLDGEVGYETDTRKMKIGDGVTLWNPLGYHHPVLTVDEYDANQLLTADNDFVRCIDNAITITLPAVAAVPIGKQYDVKNDSGNANPITVDADGTEKIDETETKVLSPGDSMTVVNDGTKWNVI